MQKIAKVSYVLLSSFNLVPRALFHGFGGGKSALGTRLLIVVIAYVQTPPPPSPLIFTEGRGVCTQAALLLSLN